MCQERQYVHICFCVGCHVGICVCLYCVAFRGCSYGGEGTQTPPETQSSALTAQTELL